VEQLEALLGTLRAVLGEIPDEEPEPVSEAEALQAAQAAYDAARAETHRLMRERLGIEALKANVRRSNNYRNRLLKADSIDQANRDAIRLG
jgi:hypothetical protein